MALNKGIQIKPILRFVSILLIAEGLFMFPAIISSLFHQTTDLIPISLSSSITLLSGLILLFSFRNSKRDNIDTRNGLVTIIFSWIIIPLFGSLPYYFSGFFDCYIDSLFESISGFTSTGATVLKDIESLPKGLILWRSLTNWLGGLGIITSIFTLLPYFGLNKEQVFFNKTSCEINQKIHPMLFQPAKQLWITYISFSILLILIYAISGMGTLDAICNGFSVISSGGFTTKNDGFNHYSTLIHYITIIFMFISGMNLILIPFLLKLNFKKIYENEEFRAYIIGLALAIGIFSFLSYKVNNLFNEDIFRYALFKIVSTISTSGYEIGNNLSGNISELNYPSIGVNQNMFINTSFFFIFLLMFIGGCSGSMAGGLKIIRPYLLIKTIFQNFKQVVHPNAVMSVKINKKSIKPEVISSILTFFFIYISTFAIGIITLVVFGVNFNDAISSSISCLSNLNSGFNISNYAHFPSETKIILSLLMLIGRLEIFSVLILTTRSY